MAEPYRLPTATVLAATAFDDVATVTIDLSQGDYPSYPLAPAALWIPDSDLQRLETDVCLFEFHQLIERVGMRFVFETYLSTQPLPVVGGKYPFCSWWNHWAMDAVLDLSTRWQRLKYPDDGSHDHCLLSWETISSYAGQPEGYLSQHGWITVTAYEEYIERDRLRIRHHWRSCETRPANLHRIDQ